MIPLHQTVAFLDSFLDVKTHGEDTGLVISGRPEVRKVGAAVDLSMYVIDRAAALGCDLLFTHHAAWRSTDADLVDVKHKLMRSRGLSLYTSHDPLDKHPEAGTAVVLAQTLGWRIRSAFCDGMGVLAESPASGTLTEVAEHVGEKLGVAPCLFDSGAAISPVAIIAGYGARPEWMAEAKLGGAMTFLSGEAIYFGKLYARESGMNLILAGHYETELPAARAILERIGAALEVETELIGDDSSHALSQCHPR